MMIDGGGDDDNDDEVDDDDGTANLPHAERVFTDVMLPLVSTNYANSIPPHCFIPAWIAPMVPLSTCGGFPHDK